MNVSFFSREVFLSTSPQKGLKCWYDRSTLGFVMKKGENIKIHHQGCEFSEVFWMFVILLMVRSKSGKLTS